MVAVLDGEASRAEVQKSVVELESVAASPPAKEPEERKIDRSEPADNGLQCK